MEKIRNSFKNILEILRYTLFSGFCLLCIWLIFFLHLLNTPPNMLFPGLVALVGIAVLSWINIRWSLGCLIVCVPVVSGLHMMGIFPVNPLCFWFAIIYLSWFAKRLFWERKTIVPPSQIGTLVDVLSGIVLLSLIWTLCRTPFDYVWNRLWYDSLITGQDDPVFCLFAAFVLLQGLFFYRIMELEADDKTGWEKIAGVLYLQAPIIILFCLLQLIYQIPKLDISWGIRLYSPFNDIHSYGSYMVFLFFFFLALTFEKNLRQRLVSALFTGFFLLFVVLSWSRETWVAFFLTGVGFLVYKLKKKHGFILAFSLLTAVALVNLFPSLLPSTKNYYLNRLERTIVAKKINIEVRRGLWYRAVGIIKDYPITGSGIGTFYKISPSYGDPDYKRIKGWHENAHNYYLQVAAELGVPVLLLFLSIIFCSYRTGIRTLSQHGEYRNIIAGLLFGLTAYLITMLVGHPLLLSNQQLLFWFVIATITIPGHLKKG